ncbi:tetratricopeptide repeat protein [Alteromonas sp. CYL-A6]|uniref:tetratricopeptide repeat protein n=1 Tax=Alteromonas nitratireducens TaxID=3390813 RepID=UPI0034B1FA83
MKYILHSLFIFVCAGLAGCATTGPSQVYNPAELLNDSLFIGYRDVSVESEDEIFALSDEAKTFVKQRTTDELDEEVNIRNLMYAIFDHADMGLIYQGDANTVASDTFANRAANCLSLSIMTYAMARYAGYQATFFEVDIPEYWTRQQGFSLINGHVNLRIVSPAYNDVTRFKDDFVDVDFDPQTIRQYFPRIAINKARVVAMFYNNKGADALIDKDFDKAYAYFRAAAITAPELAQTWTNLGVLYRFAWALDDAERTYRYVLANDDNNLTAWENLSLLYRHQGNHDDADAIMAKVESKRRDNPFYHFILGEKAVENEAYAEALTHYQRAMRLNSQRHEIMFGLVKAYYGLGDISKARRYLEMAERFAQSQQDEKRYHSKLAVLQSSL